MVVKQSAALVHCSLSRTACHENHPYQKGQSHAAINPSIYPFDRSICFPTDAIADQYPRETRHAIGRLEPVTSVTGEIEISR